MRKINKLIFFFFFQFKQLQPKVICNLILSGSTVSTLNRLYYTYRFFKFFKQLHLLVNAFKQVLRFFPNKNLFEWNIDDKENSVLKFLSLSSAQRMLYLFYERLKKQKISASLKVMQQFDDAGDFYESLF